MPTTHFVRVGRHRCFDVLRTSRWRECRGTDAPCYCSEVYSVWDWVLFPYKNALDTTKFQGTECIFAQNCTRYLSYIWWVNCFQQIIDDSSLRKTFGRQVYNMNSENSELALVKLMEQFNHSSVAITKRYLGLRQEEILETYDCLTFCFYRGDIFWTEILL